MSFSQLKSTQVQDRVRVTTMDGREFIKHAVIEALNNPFVDVRPLQSSKERARQARTGGGPPAALPVQRTIKHFVMNLPATALEFLDAYRLAFSDPQHSSRLRELYTSTTMPMVHCHCFTRELERPQAEVDILKVGFCFASISLAHRSQRAERALGVALESPSFHYVRRVAPTKDMYCLSFVLPTSIMSY
jgi:tRNA (guanine37-N1)-methyltransferase